MLSEKIVYVLILPHHHILHSSPHQQEAYLPSQKGLFHYQFLSHTIRKSKTRVQPPSILAETISPSLGKNINTCILSSDQTVCSLILRTHHRLHSSRHYQRIPIFISQEWVISLSVFIPTHQHIQVYSLSPNRTSRVYCTFLLGRIIISQL